MASSSASVWLAMSKRTLQTQPLHAANTTTRLCLQHQGSFISLAAHPSQVNWSPLVSLGLLWSPHTEKWETTWVGDHLSCRWAPLQACPAPSFDLASTTIHPRGSQKTATSVLHALCGMHSLQNACNSSKVLGIAMATAQQATFDPSSSHPSCGMLWASLPTLWVEPLLPL
jgi:hypothetical protein